MTKLGHKLPFLLLPDIGIHEFVTNHDKSRQNAIGDRHLQSNEYGFAAYVNISFNR